MPRRRKKEKISIFTIAAAPFMLVYHLGKAWIAEKDRYQDNLLNAQLVQGRLQAQVDKRERDRLAKMKDELQIAILEERLTQLKEKKSENIPQYPTDGYNYLRCSECGGLYATLENLIYCPNDGSQLVIFI